MNIADFKKAVSAKIKTLKSVRKPVTAKEFSKMEKTFHFGLLQAEDLSAYQVAFVQLLLKEFAKNIYTKTEGQNKILANKWNKKHRDVPIATIESRPLLRLPDDNEADWQLIFQTNLIDKTRGPAFYYDIKGWDIKRFETYEVAFW